MCKHTRSAKIISPDDHEDQIYVQTCTNNPMKNDAICTKMSSIQHITASSTESMANKIIMLKSSYDFFNRDYKRKNFIIIIIFISYTYLNIFQILNEEMNVLIFFNYLYTNNYKTTIPMYIILNNVFANNYFIFSVQD